MYLGSNAERLGKMTEVFDDYGNFVGWFIEASPLDSCVITIVLAIFATALYVIYKLAWLFVEGLKALFRGDFKQAIINWGIIVIAVIVFNQVTGIPVIPAQAQQPQIKETQIWPTPTNDLFATTPTTLATGEATFEWSYELKGFSGNRYDVYQQTIIKTAPHMSWQKFKDDVLIYNPQLVQDGFEFKKDKTYLLPVEK